MPVTTLDARSALIVVDLQKGILSAPVPHSMDHVVANAAALAAAFRQSGLPVVLVRVVGGAPGRNEHKSVKRERPADWTDFRAELDQQPSDHVVEKRTWGAFTGTGLEEYLKDQGVTQVVLTGCATSVGIESTARQAHELGFNVVLALDAMTDVNAEAHTNSVERIFPRLGETRKTADILDRLKSGPAV